MKIKIPYKSVVVSSVFLGVLISLQFKTINLENEGMTTSKKGEQLLIELKSLKKESNSLKEQINTIKREIKEELGKDVEIIGYISTIENFFEMKGSKYHEIMFVHKIEFANEEDKKIEYTMKNIEGKDYLQYEWLEMDKIDEYPLLPRAVKDILKENKFPIHKINNDLK